MEAEDFRHVVLKEGEVVLLASRGPLTEDMLHGFNELIPAIWRDRVLVVDGTQVDVTVVSHEHTYSVTTLRCACGARITPEEFRAAVDDEVASGLEGGPVGDPPDPESDRIP